MIPLIIGVLGGIQVSILNIKQIHKIMEKYIEIKTTDKYIKTIHDWGDSRVEETLTSKTSKIKSSILNNQDENDQQGCKGTETVRKLKCK